jgi:hypothetical protein
MQNITAVQAQYDLDIGFAISLAVNSILFFVFFACFLFFKKRVKNVYEPLTLNDDSKSVFNISSPDGGIFGWALSAWKVSDETIHKQRGLGNFNFKS